MSWREFPLGNRSRLYIITEQECKTAFKNHSNSGSNHVACPA